MAERKIGTDGYKANNIIEAMENNPMAYADFTKNWKKLPPELIDKSEIEIVRLERKSLRDEPFHDILCDLLSVYVARKSHEATIDAFCDALESAGFIGLADSVRENFKIAKTVTLPKNESEQAGSSSSIGLTTPAKNDTNDTKKMTIIFKDEEGPDKAFQQAQIKLTNYASFATPNDIDLLIMETRLHLGIDGADINQLLSCKLDEKEKIKRLFGLIGTKQVLDTSADKHKVIKDFLLILVQYEHNTAIASAIKDIVEKCGGEIKGVK